MRLDFTTFLFEDMLIDFSIKLLFGFTVCLVVLTDALMLFAGLASSASGASYMINY